MDGSFVSGLGGAVLGPRLHPQPRAQESALAALGFAALASIPLATALVGPTGLVYLNSAALQLLAAGDGLHRSPGTDGLAANSRIEGRYLQALIASALAGHAGGRVPVRRERSPMPLLVSVSPLRLAALDGFADAAGFALVLIHDPLAGCVDTGHKALVDIYDLTEAEACVAAAIVGGLNAKRIALQRGVSVPTVRSQIRQILLKTGCSDQREFVSRFGWLRGAN